MKTTLPDGLKPTNNPNIAIFDEKALTLHDLPNIHLPKDLDEVEIRLHTINDVKRAIESKHLVVERQLVAKNGNGFTAYYLIVKFKDILNAGKY